jgi:predicted GNAT family acetyltransferase
VIGEAATAAAFAGTWAQEHRVPCVPTEGERVYRLGALRSVAVAPGRPRVAAAEDRELLVEWYRAFQVDTDGHVLDPVGMADRSLAEGSVSIWEDGTAVAMANHAPETGGVVRIGPVYTPPETRGRGYATACVEHVSRSIVAAGHTAILHTQLANPTSNGIYQRIGYEPVLEALRYRFGPQT